MGLISAIKQCSNSFGQMARDIMMREGMTNRRMFFDTVVRTIESHKSFPNNMYTLREFIQVSEFPVEDMNVDKFFNGIKHGMWIMVDDGLLEWMGYPMDTTKNRENARLRFKKIIDEHDPEKQLSFELTGRDALITMRQGMISDEKSTPTTSEWVKDEKIVVTTPVTTKEENESDEKIVPQDYGATKEERDSYLDRMGLITPPTEEKLHESYPVPEKTNNPAAEERIKFRIVQPKLFHEAVMSLPGAKGKKVRRYFSKLDELMLVYDIYKDVYNFIIQEQLRSPKPIDSKKWVTSEVLPSIRGFSKCTANYIQNANDSPSISSMAQYCVEHISNVQDPNLIADNTSIKVLNLLNIDLETFKGCRVSDDGLICIVDAIAMMKPCTKQNALHAYIDLKRKKNSNNAHVYDHTRAHTRSILAKNNRTYEVECCTFRDFLEIACHLDGPNFTALRKEMATISSVAAAGDPTGELSAAMNEAKENIDPVVQAVMMNGIESKRSIAPQHRLVPEPKMKYNNEDGSPMSITQLAFKFYRKSGIYFLRVGEREGISVYKYGLTGSFWKRMKDHQYNFKEGYEFVAFVPIADHIVLHDGEKYLEECARMNGTLISFNCKKECIRTDNVQYYIDETKKYATHHNANKDYAQVIPFSETPISVSEIKLRTKEYAKVKMLSMSSLDDMRTLVDLMEKLNDM